MYIRAVPVCRPDSRESRRPTHDSPRRAPFTLRWLAYASSVGFPFKVLIADGGSDDSVQRAVSTPGVFPGLQYEYVRYGYDASYTEFYAKIENALSRIHTPFVAMLDNDDFLIANALRKAVAYLVDHPDYAACGGQWGAFWVLPSGDEAAHDLTYGARIEWKCTSGTVSLRSPSATERVRDQSQIATYPLYYHVRRTAEAHQQFQLIRELDLRDFFLYEQLLAFLTAISGKTHQLDALYLARQWNSVETAGGTHAKRFGDWFGRMLVPSWSEDFSKFLAATSTALADKDGIPLDEARRWIVQSYRMEVAPPLLDNLLAEPTVTAPMSIVVRLVRRLLSLPPTSPLRKMATAIYRRTPWLSPDILHGTQIRGRRVPNAADEMRLIRSFLTRRSNSTDA